MFRQTIGMNFADPQSFRHIPRGLLMVSGQQNRCNALRLDLSDRIRRIAAQRIGQSRKTGRIFIDCL